MPIKYVPFIPEPVEGQAVLGNFNRILRYKGADDVSMTLQRGMPLYEMEKQETVGENSDGNMVIRGECVSACAYLKEQGIQVDLVYIDPPFASGADYAKKVYIRRNPKVAEVIAQAEQELDVDELKAFEEKMYGDVWDKEKYLNWMYENLMAIKSVMSENASIYVHIDWHIGHYVKILLDEVFGEDNFRNEITWVRTASHNDSKQNYSRVKDSIFFYSRSEEYPFNIQYTPYTEDYIADEWTKAPSGRYYKFENMLDPQNKMAAYDFHGTVARWRTTPEKFEELWNAPQTEVPNSHGRVRLGKNGKPIKRCRIVFMDELPGVPLNDNWSDIAYVAGRSAESANYSTQKPEALTEILISDLLEFVHQYSVPRYKLKNRSGKNNSQQGTDVIAYKYKNEDKTPNDKDELVAAEVKATLSNMEYTPIKNAIIDSRKDEHRLARSVNYCRKRLKELGKIEEAEEVKRFLFKPDNNYRITYVAAGVSSRENVDDAIELGFSGEELEIRKNELIFYVHGQKLMELAHNIYQRCCK